MIVINANYENSVTVLYGQENFTSIDNSSNTKDACVDPEVEYWEYMELFSIQEDDYEEGYCVDPEVEYQEYIDNLKDQGKIKQTSIRWEKAMNEFF